VAVDLCCGHCGGRTRPGICPSRSRQRSWCESFCTIPAVAGRPHPALGDCGQRRSDNIEGELVEHRLLGGLGVLADEIDLAVRATAMVKAHDVTVGR